MAHDHAHGAGSGPGHERRLLIALALTGTFLVVEAIGGFLTRSLALLSDAAHMLTDVAALALALFAIRMGRRAADLQRTFGYYRLEILAAAVNAAALLLIGLYILYEAYRRLAAPVEVQSGAMLVVAVVGLIVNLISARVLAGGSAESLNVKGAYLEVLADLLGSVGVIVAALAVRFTGATWVDPVVAALIGLWVFPRTWVLLRDSVNVLLEGVPRGFRLRELHAALAALPGVREVHDLHVWSVTSGQNSMTVHLVVDGPLPIDLVERAREVAHDFGVEHTTVQLETPEQAAREENVHHFDAGRNS